MCYRAGNVHARGHGLQSLGDMNQDELERKRLKTLEHQVISLEICHSVSNLTSYHSLFDNDSLAILCLHFQDFLTNLFRINMIMLVILNQAMMA